MLDVYDDAYSSGWRGGMSTGISRAGLTALAGFSGSRRGLGCWLAAKNGTVLAGFGAGKWPVVHRGRETPPWVLVRWDTFEALATEMRVYSAGAARNGCGSAYARRDSFPTSATGHGA